MPTHFFCSFSRNGRIAYASSEIWRESWNEERYARNIYVWFLFSYVLEIIAKCNERRWMEQKEEEKKREKTTRNREIYINNNNNRQRNSTDIRDRAHNTAKNKIPAHNGATRNTIKQKSYLLLNLPLPFSCLLSSSECTEPVVGIWYRSSVSKLGGSSQWDKFLAKTIGSIISSMCQPVWWLVGVHEIV